MRLNRGFIVSIFLIICCCFPLSLSAMGNQELREAEELIENKQYDEAVKVLTQVLEDNPSMLNPVQNLFGRIQAKQNEINRVRSEMVAVLDSDEGEDVRNQRLTDLSEEFRSLKAQLTDQDEVDLRNIFFANAYAVIVERRDDFFAEAEALIRQEEYSQALEMYSLTFELTREIFDSMFPAGNEGADYFIYRNLSIDTVNDIQQSLSSIDNFYFEYVVALEDIFDQIALIRSAAEADISPLWIDLFILDELLANYLSIIFEIVTQRRQLIDAYSELIILERTLRPMQPDDALLVVETREYRPVYYLEFIANAVYRGGRTGDSAELEQRMGVLGALDQLLVQGLDRGQAAMFDLSFQLADLARQELRKRDLFDISYYNNLLDSSINTLELAQDFDSSWIRYNEALTNNDGNLSEILVSRYARSEYRASAVALLQSMQPLAEAYRNAVDALDFSDITGIAALDAARETALLERERMLAVLSDRETQELAALDAAVLSQIPAALSTDMLINDTDMLAADLRGKELQLLEYLFDRSIEEIRIRDARSFAAYRGLEETIRFVDPLVIIQQDSQAHESIGMQQLADYLQAFQDTYTTINSAVSGLGSENYRYPRESLPVYRNMLPELQEMLSGIEQILARIESEPDYVQNASRISVQKEQLEEYRTMIDELLDDIPERIAIASNNFEIAENLRQQGAAFAARVSSALSAEDFLISFSFLDQAKSLYEESLDYQEYASLRQWLADYKNQETAIQTEYESWAVRRAGQQLSEAITAFSVGEIREAETSVNQASRTYLLPFADVLDRAETADRRQELADEFYSRDSIGQNIRSWLQQVDIAMRASADTSIDRTNPIHDEVVSMLNLATIDFNKGRDLVSQGQAEAAQEQFQLANLKLSTIRSAFPRYQKANVLAFLIVKYQDEEGFEQRFRDRYNDALGLSRDGNLQAAYDELVVLQQINPNYPGLRQNLLELEYQLGLRIRPLDPAIVARAQALLREASNYTYNFPNRYDLYQRSLRLLSDALELNPTLTEAFTVIARVQALQQQNRGRVIPEDFNRIREILSFAATQPARARVLLEQLLDERPYVADNPDVIDLKERLF